MTDWRPQPHHITTDRMGSCREYWWTWSCVCGEAGHAGSEDDAEDAGHRHAMAAPCNVPVTEGADV